MTLQQLVDSYKNINIYYDCNEHYFVTEYFGETFVGLSYKDMCDYIDENLDDKHELYDVWKRKYGEICIVLENKMLL